MTYSCSDFTDSILDALEIQVPEEDMDDPSAQDDMALEEIERLQINAKRLKRLRELVAPEIAQRSTGNSSDEPTCAEMFEEILEILQEES